MIIEEMVGTRVRHYSDAGMMIRQAETGRLYIDAVDVPGTFSYEETDEPIAQDEIDDSEALAILLGEETT